VRYDAIASLSCLNKALQALVMHPQCQQTIATISHLLRNRSFFGVFEVCSLRLQVVFAQKCQCRIERGKKTPLRVPLMTSYRIFPPVGPICGRSAVSKTRNQLMLSGVDDVVMR
jgi:hypothetical protein